MTEKRFTYEYDEYNGNLFDNKMNTFYHIEDSDENIEVLCDRLNWLVEENEQLKRENYELHKRLGDFEPFEEYIKERTSKTFVNDIIGLVKTEERTDSVELKKELYK